MNSSDPSISKRIEALAAEFEKRWVAEHPEFLPWTAQQNDISFQQAAIRAVLRRRAGGHNLSENCFISQLAHIYTYKLSIGSRSYVAAGVILRGDISIGDDSTINPYSHIAGTVNIGSGVRIAGNVSIYGFNHGYDRTDIPIFQQPHTSIGISIGNGTWIGANAVVIDGVSIGEHCIVAGGAVVTKSCGDFAVIGGNPAKLIRSRL